MEIAFLAYAADRNMKRDCIFNTQFHVKILCRYTEQNYRKARKIGDIPRGNFKKVLYVLWKIFLYNIFFVLKCTSVVSWESKKAYRFWSFLRFKYMKIKVLTCIVDTDFSSVVQVYFPSWPSKNELALTNIIVVLA